MSRVSRCFAVGLLVFAFVALLGHVCVLPHVAVVEAAVPGGHHDHDAGHDADETHLASCEAIRPGATASSVSMPAVNASIVVARVVPHAKEAPSPQIVPVGSPPPLYLLKSVLLI
jgi:hypothetical protein